MRQSVRLEDKYELESGQAYLTGIEALVRLPISQRRRDLRAGKNTAGYVSGYQGSPLSGLDIAMGRASRHLEGNHIRFSPGLNEDLAATAIWGTQQVNLFAGGKYDGVFSMWYGKGPGIDRSGDVFVHGNAAGTSPNGGVLLIAGDDHAARTTTTPHQSEVFFSAAMIPTVNPTDVQEYLDLGLHGWAMSRFSGLWVGFKAVCDNIESSANVEIDPDRVSIVLPEVAFGPSDINIRWPDPPLEQERRLKEVKIAALLAYVRANRLNYLHLDSARARFGIVAAGKAFLDVLEALTLLGIDESTADAAGLRLLKLGVTWPLEPQCVRDFARGLERVLVVEEKRPLIEMQLKDQLYNWRESERPSVFGKYAGAGQWDGLGEAWLLSSLSELNPVMIARVIARHLIACAADTQRLTDALTRLDRREAERDALRSIPIAYGTKALMTNGRLPYYCSGCPHNTSTKVPQGSRALAGIGCHFMAMWMDRSTTTVCQMGGEGVPWIGQSAFTETKHVFANLGDGTYLHSGTLAIRAAVAANVNITYKILLNGSVAMTGGQALPMALTAQKISEQIAAENVRHIRVVTGDPGRYEGGFAAGVRINHRDEMDAVQRELREIPGVSVLIYDQGCATDKRRRRKQHREPDPARFAFINHRVCEGCGDCGTESNCMSVLPLDTVWGRKRRIDQASCNKDYSCQKGFCPSFVTVEGGSVRKGRGLNLPSDLIAGLTAPPLPALSRPYDILICGVGGSGILTVGALLGMASHIDDRRVKVLDMTGLAQKGGAVMSHVRIGEAAGALRSSRIPLTADVILGCDIAVSCEDPAIDLMSRDTTQVFVNTFRSAAAEFIKNGDLIFPRTTMVTKLEAAVGPANLHAIDATESTTALLGNSIYANILLLGFAFQRGALPISLAAIETALTLHNVDVEANKAAFTWGRLLAVHPNLMREAQPEPAEETTDQIVARCYQDLVQYQDRAYAERYAILLRRVQEADGGVEQSRFQLTRAVARNYYKLLAYKDEYEVARHYAGEDFRRALAEQFEGRFRLRIHLAPPLMSKIDPASGRPRKRTFGPWIFPILRILSRGKVLRGTRWDPFGYTAERQTERALISDYERSMEQIMKFLSASTYEAAVQLAGIPEMIRGFGPVKSESVDRARARARELMNALRATEFAEA
jgi:indolepyruvate ferredoxin oxidoreductase